MTTSTRAAVVATVGAVALLLTGCTGGSDKPGDASSERELGPLDEYMEKIYSQQSEEDMDAQMREVEEITAACMAEQGFDYTPLDPATDGATMGVGTESEIEWGTREFVEEFGYGASTNPWGDEAGAVPEEEYVDPNAEYVEAMAPEEQEAYFAALYGEPQGSEDPEEIVEWDWTKAGCSGKAQHEVYETVDGVDADEFTALQEEMTSVWEGVMNDPRLAEINGDWASCMADAGYTFATPEDAANSIYELTNKVYDEAYADVDYESATTEEDFAAIEAEVQEIIDARMAEITDTELATALADFECKEESGYDERYQEISFELQQSFVDEHKDTLDAWVASVEAS